MDWFKIGKGVRQGCMLSPCLFNFYAEYITGNVRLDEAQTGIKTARRSINNLRYADDTTLMAESKKKPKSLLMKLEEESEKAGLTQYSKNKDHGIWSHHFTANRWGKQWKQWETIILGSKITADGDCSHEIKRCLLLGRKDMTNLDSILKSRPLPTKVLLVKAMVFPVVMYGCDSWTIKKAECWRIDTFELWCWRRCLRVPWTAKRSNQLILKEINPEYSLEGLMLKLMLQYFSHLMQRANSLEKILMLRDWRKGWDGWMASLTQWIWVWANSRRWWTTGKPGLLQSTGLQRVGHEWTTAAKPRGYWGRATA